MPMVNNSVESCGLFSCMTDPALYDMVFILKELVLLPWNLEGSKHEPVPQGTDSTHERLTWQEQAGSVAFYLLKHLI